MTTRVKHVALLVAVVLLGGSAVFLMAKQSSKVPTDTTDYFCPYQTTGWHLGMQPMMMSGYYSHMGMEPMKMMSGPYMSSSTKAGNMNGRSDYYCYFAEQLPSAVKPAPNDQTPGSTPKNAPDRHR